MTGHTVEIKAVCGDLARAARQLETLGARCVGLDRQVDTYFHVPSGRLKLREGTIERSLIHYHRPDQTGPKECAVTLVELPAGGSLRPVLTAALGVRVEVVKARQIWFLGSVKVHLDELAELGTFVEIEAIDRDGSVSAEVLLGQCRALMQHLGVGEGDLVAGSYSDLLLALHPPAAPGGGCCTAAEGVP